MKNISINPDNQIFMGNKCVGYIDDNDVYYFVKNYAEKIGAINHKAEIGSLISQFEKNLMAINWRK